VRRMLALLVTGTVLMPLAACGSGPDPGAGAAPSAGSPSAGSPPAVSPSTASPSTRNSAATTPKPSATATAGPTATTRPPATTAAPPGSDELPGELPHGNRELTGVVERSGDCALLRVDDRLWGLTGSLVQRLRSGDRVTVRGQITTAAGSCAEAGATRSMVVRSVT
jgi:hypothetical protein